MLLDNLMSIHRLLQITTAKPDLTRSYPTLNHFRNAANQRTSLKNSYFLISKELLDLCGVTENGKLFKDGVCVGVGVGVSVGVGAGVGVTGADISLLQPPLAFTISGSPSDSTNNTRRSNRRLIQATGGGVATGHTPSRNVSDVFDKIRNKPENQRTEIEKRLLSRQMTCIGPTIRLVKKVTTDVEEEKNIISPQGTCAVCQKQSARSYCFGCHMYFHCGNQCPLFDTNMAIQIPGTKKRIC